jgi:hypothetical protein
VDHFEGFNGISEDGKNMTCTQRIKGLDVTLALTDEFYVAGLANTHMVLGVQWLYSMGDILMNYQEMMMAFRDKGGQ